MREMDFCTTSVAISIICGALFGLVTFMLFVVYWFGSRSSALYDSLTPPGLVTLSQSRCVIRLGLTILRFPKNLFLNVSEYSELQWNKKTQIVA